MRIDSARAVPLSELQGWLASALAAAVEDVATQPRADADLSPERVAKYVAGAAALVFGFTVTRAAFKAFPKTAVALALGKFAVATGGLIASVQDVDRDERTLRERDHALRELWKVARPYHRQLGFAIGATVISRLAQVAYVAVLGTLTDALLGKGRVMFLGRRVRRTVSVPRAVGAAVVLIGICSLFDYLSKVWWMRAGHQVSDDLRVRLYRHVQSLEMEEFANQDRGHFLALLNEDINRIELLFTATWGVWKEVSYALCCGAGFFVSSPAFAGLAAVPMPTLLWLAHTMEKRIRPRFSAIRAQAGVLHGVLSSNLDGLGTIRAFAGELFAEQWVADSSARYRDEQQEALRIVSAYNPAVIAAANGLRLMTATAAGYSAQRGDMTTGTYMTLVILSTSLALPMLSVARDLPHILSTVASLSRIFDAFHLPREHGHEGAPLDSAGVQGDLRFEDLHFTYPGTTTPIFEGLELAAPAGRMTAFVGGTGSGKSTLAKLLLRFYDPTDGTIRLDERDITELKAVDVRRSIAYVGQEIFLFGGSIRDNISFGDPEVPHERIRQVAEWAGVHDFVAGLPQGYDTRVGHRGHKLSGGQRQRIGIARALLLDKPIVILDEVTSALDAATEARLLESLGKQLQGRTVLVIAHRLSAVRHADHIHVLDAGKLVESGNHETLLELNGRYATFWALQTHRSGGKLSGSALS